MLESWGWQLKQCDSMIGSVLPNLVLFNLENKSRKEEKSWTMRWNGVLQSEVMPSSSGLILIWLAMSKKHWHFLGVDRSLSDATGLYRPNCICWLDHEKGQILNDASFVMQLDRRASYLRGIQFQMESSSDQCTRWDMKLALDQKGDMKLPML